MGFKPIQGDYISKPTGAAANDLLAFIGTDWNKVQKAWATGDIPYLSGTGWERLPKGTDGQVLELANGLPSWKDKTEPDKLSVILDDCSQVIHASGEYFYAKFTGLNSTTSGMSNGSYTYRYWKCASLGDNGKIVFNDTNFPGLPDRGSKYWYQPYATMIKGTANTSAFSKLGAVGLVPGSVNFGANQYVDPGNTTTYAGWRSPSLADNTSVTVWQCGWKSDAVSTGYIRHDTSVTGNLTAYSNLSLNIVTMYQNLRTSYGGSYYPTYCGLTTDTANYAAFTFSEVATTLRIIPKNTEFHTLATDGFMGRTIKGIRDITLFDTGDIVYINDATTKSNTLTGDSASPKIITDRFLTNNGDIHELDDIYSFRWEGNPQITFYI